MYDSETIALIDESFATAAVNATAFVEAFYENLFAHSPHLRPMFPEDLTEQGSKLAGTLSLAVDCLDEGPGWLAPKLRSLGATHSRHGVGPEHYPIVAEVLIATFQQRLSSFFTEAHADAWAQVLGDIAEQMIIGATEGEVSGAA